MANPYYSGPVTDHFDGERFYIDGVPNARRRLRPLAMLRWQFSRERKRWTDVPTPLPPDLPPARSAAIRVGFVGHASTLLQVAGVNILIDPVWSERASPFLTIGPKRVNPPGIRFEDLPKIDVVLLSHNHYDHMDLETMRRLQTAHAPRVITPLGNDAILRAGVADIAVETGDWGARFDLAPQLDVTLHPSRHWSARSLSDRRMALWSGFVLRTPYGVIYHTGDTSYGDGAFFRAVRRDFGPVRLAFLPIGAYEPRAMMQTSHTSPAEAVQIFQDVEARDALGFHWGTFQLSSEAIEQPAEDLAIALDAAGIERARFQPMRPGESFGFA